MIMEEGPTTTNASRTCHMISSTPPAAVATTAAAAVELLEITTIHNQPEASLANEAELPRITKTVNMNEEACGGDMLRILQVVSSESVDETTSSLASFDLGAEEEQLSSLSTDSCNEGEDVPITTVVLDSIDAVENAAPVIADPIEGHDSAFDVELSPMPIATDTLQADGDDYDDQKQKLQPSQLLQNRAYKGGIYGKVVKSIQRSFRKIFHTPNHQQQVEHQTDEKEADASTHTSCEIKPIYDDIPSIAIQASQSGNSIVNPISSIDPNAAFHTTPSLHKTLLIDVTYSKPLLSLPRPGDEHKKCLVLDLDETLVHSTFQPTPTADLVVPVHLGEGIFQPIYVSKRPGVDAFLQAVTELFEVVIFTASLSNYADPVIDFLDPQGGIKFRLYREDCLQFQGMYIKDLSRLGRDLQQVLIIDNSPASYSMQPHNALGCRSWFKDPHDRELEERILPMLKKLCEAPSVVCWRSENVHAIETPYGVPLCH